MTDPGTFSSPLDRRLLTSGVLFGIGVAAFVDEVVFHQLLHWHHFYDLSTTRVGLVSDGVLHAFGWFATVAGLFLLADVRRRRGPGIPRWWPAVLVGAGGFQLFDGILVHKVLRVHQVRYEVVPAGVAGPGPHQPVDDLLVYDVAWLASGALPLVVGLVAWRLATRKSDARRAPD
ncbi:MULTISPECIES: DUF2243 domain-containing protein [unclassified Serinicoccus]|uniref:DUF2243 domain-containing protein n=1 Tax=unclassified Serinicoccus TaxID=2643101 RepID=UPI003851E99B